MRAVNARMTQARARRFAWLVIPFTLLVATSCGQGASVTIVSDFGTNQDDSGGRVVVSTDTGIGLRAER